MPLEHPLKRLVGRKTKRERSLKLKRRKSNRQEESKICPDVVVISESDDVSSLSQESFAESLSSNHQNTSQTPDETPPWSVGDYAYFNKPIPASKQPLLRVLQLLPSNKCLLSYRGKPLTLQYSLNCLVKAKQKCTAPCSDKNDELAYVLGPYKVMQSEMVALECGQDLSDSLISACLHSLIQKYNGKASVDLVNPFVIQKILLSTDDSSLSRYENLWKSWIEKDYLIAPFLEPGISDEDRMHWVLIVFSIKKKICFYLNSLGELTAVFKHYLKMLRYFHSRVTLDKEAWTAMNIRHNKQGDEHSCGLFVCQFAKDILESDFSVNRIDIKVKSVRATVLNLLKDQSEDLSLYCTFCTFKKCVCKS